MVDRQTSGSTSGKRPRASLRRMVVGYLAAIAAVLVAGIAVAAGPSPSPAPPTDTVTLAARGAQLYAASCAACHGPQGAGSSIAPEVRDAGAALVDFVLRTGRMPLADPADPEQRGAPAFNDADRSALVAYVSSLGNGPAVPQVVVGAGDLSKGRDLFLNSCAACHGPAGGGGAIGGGVNAPPLLQADPTTVGEAVVSGPGPMPKFSFSPEQLDSIAAYVQYLRNPASPGGASGPEVGPVTEGFVAGIALVLLLLVARWVGVRREREP